MPLRLSRRTVLIYVRRYALAEACGTLSALFAAWTALHGTGSFAAAAIAGTLGENIGYYGATAVQDSLHWWRRYRRQPRQRRAWQTVVSTVRGMLLEFGPAEIIDSFFVRPGLMYLLPAYLPGPPLLLLFIGKILSDIVFYTFAIAGNQLSKYIEKRSLIKQKVTPAINETALS